MEFEGHSGGGGGGFGDDDELFAADEFPADGGEDALEILDEHGGAAAAASGASASAPAAGKGKAVDPSQRVTTRYMTKYERARLLGTRALQLRCVASFFAKSWALCACTPYVFASPPNIQRRCLPLALLSRLLPRSWLPRRGANGQRSKALSCAAKICGCRSESYWCFVGCMPFLHFFACSMHLLQVPPAPAPRRRSRPLFNASLAATTRHQWLTRAMKRTRSKSL